MSFVGGELNQRGETFSNVGRRLSMRSSADSAGIGVPGGSDRCILRLYLGQCRCSLAIVLNFSTQLTPNPSLPTHWLMWPAFPAPSALSSVFLCDFGTIRVDFFDSHPFESLRLSRFAFGINASTPPIVTCSSPTHFCRLVA
jgi:hypothetical protein